MKCKKIEFSSSGLMKKVLVKKSNGKKEREREKERVAYAHSIKKSITVMNLPLTAC